MNIRAYSSIREIKERWNELFKNNPYLSWYQSYEWNESLEDKYHDRKWTRYLGCKLTYLAFEEAVIAPLVIDERHKQIAFLGENESSDYLSFIYASETALELFEEIILWIVSEYSQYSIALHRINESNPLCDMLKTICKRGIIKADIETRECVQIVDLPKSDGFYNSLSKSARQNYRTAINRIHKAGLEYRIDTTNNILQRDIAEQLFKIYSERRKECDEIETKTIVKNRLNRFIKKVLGEKDVDVLSDYSLKASVFLSRIYINNQIAAFCEGGFDSKNKISISRVATASAFYHYSPGQILLIETIEQLRKEITTFDLTRGTESYKFTLGGLIHYNYNFVLSEL